MRAKVSQYRREGKLALKHMWFVVLLFAIVQVIVSIAVAATNSKTGGYKSASFAAIWSMFLVIGFTTVGGQIVFGGKSTELLVGFMIGVAFMLCELFFVLMVAFFILGAEAAHNQYVSANSDKAYGAFSLLNMIIYFVWAIILTVHRKTVMVSQKEVEAANAKEFSAYDGTGGETFNPTIGAAGGEEYHDQEEL